MATDIDYNKGRDVVVVVSLPLDVFERLTILCEVCGVTVQGAIREYVEECIPELEDMPGE
jgi:predicted DNA-binding protein